MGGGFLASTHLPSSTPYSVPSPCHSYNSAHPFIPASNSNHLHCCMLPFTSISPKKSSTPVAGSSGKADPHTTLARTPLCIISTLRCVV
ncbi:hypothetical protein E2C01_095226 [Portunus trituberculatus]|uniref:Uncharacterized protein n=1 Tax=Portunus trituberculatus TaxID=210409 RepID=A0A5B7K3N1_PORTR|nr:hypothetical protein [Portunus trituberculatus]